MEALLAVVGFALLFALFAASGVAERTRPCSGRSGSGEERCSACPLREEGSGALGPCTGADLPGEEPR